MIETNRKKYSISEILSKEEISHYFLPRNNIIYSYVLEDENKKIKDFFTFYGLSRTILNNNSKYKKINLAYSIINYNSSIPMKELLKSEIIIAKQNNFDALHCINCKEYSDNFKDLLFTEKVGKIKYYFYNFVCHGTEAIGLLLQYAFSQMNLNRVYLRVCADNERAVRCYEKCGFREEGRFREHVYLDGQYRDVLQMAILQREFEAMKTEKD